jgi:hypothetical protein
MTALDTLRHELTRIQQAQSECVTDSGLVRTECRERYQILTRKARAFRESIEFMEKIKIGGESS